MTSLKYQAVFKNRINGMLWKCFNRVDAQENI